MTKKNETPETPEVTDPSTPETPETIETPEGGDVDLGEGSSIDELMDDLPDEVKDHIASLQAEADKGKKFEQRYKRSQKKFKEKNKGTPAEPSSEEQIEAYMQKRELKESLGDEVFSKVEEIADNEGVNLKTAHLIYLGQVSSDPQHQAQQNAGAGGLHGAGASSPGGVETTRLSGGVDSVINARKAKLEKGK